MDQIFRLLENHASDEMQSLATVVEDPETGKHLRTFYMVLRGVKTDARKHILNVMLCIYAHACHKKEFKGRDIEEMTEQEQADVRIPAQGFVCTTATALLTLFFFLHFQSPLPILLSSPSTNRRLFVPSSRVSFRI